MDLDPARIVSLAGISELPEDAEKSAAEVLNATWRPKEMKEIFPEIWMPTLSLTDYSTANSPLE